MITFQNRVIVFIGVCFYVVVRTFGVSTGKCHRGCDFITLSCPSGKVIYNPDVSGYDDRNCGNSSKTSCTGMSPNLKVSVLNCYWKNKCNIQYTNQAMAMDIAEDRMQCFNREIKSIKVHGWSCIKESDVYDICDNGSSVITPEVKTQGVIRSHVMFPWNYKLSLFSKSNCSKTLSPSLSDSGLYRVAVWVHHLDVDVLEWATISFINSLNESDRTERNLIKDFHETAIKSKFEIAFTTPNNAYAERNTGSGFVICFKFLKKDESGGNICEEIFENKTTSKCRTCNYRSETSNCSLESKSYTTTKTLINRSSSDVCPLETNTTYYCTCDYIEETSTCNLTTNSYRTTKTLDRGSNPNVCASEIVTNHTCNCDYKNVSKKCEIKKKLYTCTINSTLIEVSSKGPCVPYIVTTHTCNFTYKKKSCRRRLMVYVRKTAKTKPSNLCPKRVRMKVPKCPPKCQYKKIRWRKCKNGKQIGKRVLNDNVAQPKNCKKEKLKRRNCKSDT